MKNKLLVFTLIMISLFSNGQIINFPDANFKNALVNIKCVDIDGDQIPDHDADSNNDGEIDVNEATEVNRIYFVDLEISNIDGVEYFSNLIDLFLDNNNLTSLNLSNLPKLSSIRCNNNQISRIKLSNLGIWSLECNNNNITEIILDLPNLLILSCNNNLLNSIDINHLEKLSALYCNNNKLNTLFIKNGNLGQSIQFDNNPNLNYICCSNSNINFIEHLALSYGLQNCEINSFCTFTPGGAFYTINGKAIFDLNKDGCNDADTYYSALKYNITNGIIRETILNNFSKSYLIRVQAGTHIIKPILEDSDFYYVSPDSISVTFPSTSDTIIQDFCITPKGIHKQIDLSIIHLSPPARPGFDTQYKVIMTNKGNQVENGTLYFAYDEAKMDFVSTDVNPSTQSDGLLSWNFTDLLPFETRYYNVTLNVNSPSETPPVNAGDELLITCNILDNVFLLKQEVVGSYDPNDKTCLEGKNITPEQVGEYVHYLIRFENTGNYAAENVVVKDVIDESTFDISTLQITDASHEAWARINGNVVEFIFENIQLPFEDASNDGYICFKIKTKPTLVLGNELKNEANIYFDYNLPILTNMTNTVVALPTSTDEALGESDIEIFPNPVNDVLKFSGEDKILKVEVFDLSGRLMQVSSVVNGEVNVERLLSGAYQLKVYTLLGVRNSKMVKI